LLIIFQCPFVVAGYLRSHVGHATVANFDVVAIEDFMEFMMLREIFFNNFKKVFSNISLDLFVKRGVVPQDISFSGSIYIYIYIYTHT